MDPSDPRIGTVVQGEFVVERPAGDDELGALYEAHNARRKGRYQLLFLRKELSPPLRAMVAVRNDLRKARELSPLGLLPIETLADARGDACFAAELLPGETLLERLQRGPMSPESALTLFGVLGRTLSEMHAAGLLHGRLRPAHVRFVQPEARGPHASRALLLGHSLHHLLRALDPRKLAAVELERLRHCPPERIVAGSAAPKTGPADDVYALAALLYHCLAGHPAFPGSSVEEVLAQRQGPFPQLAPVPERGLAAPLCATLNVVLAGATAREPAARVADVGQFLGALRQVAEGAGLPWSGGEVGSVSRRQVSIVQHLSGIFGLPRRRGEPKETLTEAPTRPPAATSPAPLSTPAAPAAPPPIPPAASGVLRPTEPVTGSVTAPRQPPPAPASDPSLLRDRTQILRRDDTVRTLRGRDISVLIKAVQSGALDPQAAVEQAQTAEEVLLPPDFWQWLAARPTRAVAAGVVLMALAYLVLLLVRHH